jgi:predicted enzyme related to lactoylglutathione lyase
MGERTSYTPGTFSWAELATSDTEGAKAFYNALLGWEYDDNPIGDGMVYSMARRDGKNVAALFDSEQPPHWNCYVTVASADDAAARAGKAGGTVRQEPFDVMDVGRMAVIADPAGAVLSVWEPRASIGAQLVNTPGAMTWNDLVTSDPEDAIAFYGSVFGWTFNEIPDAGGYHVIFNGERSNGGLMPIDPIGPNAHTPPSWWPYFGHEDLERAIGEAEALGGRLFAGPTQMPAGSIAVLGDAQGAVFALWTGSYED